MDFVSLHFLLLFLFICFLEGLFFVSGRDPVVIERSNLLNISKLVVKELIEQSLRFGRMLDSDHMPLQHFFIVLEHVLRHGLRPKKVNKRYTTVLNSLKLDKGHLFTTNIT